MKIFQFGGFEVWQDDIGPVKRWPQRKTKGLLKLLLSQRGQIFTQDQLIDALFPDLELDKAAKTLYNRISELRRVLEPELARGNRSCYILRVGQGSYRFNPDVPCWIDTEEFQRLVEAARQLKEAGRWQEAVQAYARAVELHRGEYLAEDRYEEWTQGPRQQWMELHQQALLEQAQCHAQLQQHDAAIGCVQEAIRSQPWHEPAYRKLMLYAFYSGDHAQVVQAYKRCIAALKEHLDVGPDRETENLYQQLCQSQEVELPVVQAPSAPSQLPVQAAAASPTRATRPPRAVKGAKRALLTLMIVGLMSLLGQWTFSQLNPAPQRFPSMAVLPLVGIASSEFEGWFLIDDFADAISMELTYALDQIPDLRVASATSAFAFKDKRLSVTEIGRALGVESVLEGSVRRWGNHLRITMRLIDVDDGLHLWSGEYERAIYPQSFAYFEEIISPIVKSIVAKLEAYLRASRTDKYLPK
ncbi:MAG TPA: BTAD domain-containing putative transcriptional regulator [Candidatus Bipolaricaulota bacterium]